MCTGVLECLCIVSLVLNANYSTPATEPSTGKCSTTKAARHTFSSGLNDGTKMVPQPSKDLSHLVREAPGRYIHMEPPSSHKYQGI